MKSKLMILLTVLATIGMLASFSLIGCKEETVETVDEEAVEEEAAEEVEEEAVEEEPAMELEETDKLVVVSYKNPGVTEEILLSEIAEAENFEYEWISIPPGEYHDKIALEFFSGEATWDVLYTYSPWTNEFAPYLHDITELLSEDVKNSVLDATKEASVVGDIWYGLPGFLHVPVLHYQKDLFEENNIINPPSNFDELFETAAKLTNDEVYGFGLAGASYDLMLHFLWNLHTVGGKFYSGYPSNMEDKSPAFNNEYGARSLTLLTKLYSSDFSDPSGMTSWESDMRKAVASGADAMSFISAGTVDAIIAKEYPERIGNIGYAMLPGDTGEGALPGALENGIVSPTVMGFVIRDGATNLNNALKYLEYQFSPDAQKFWIEDYGCGPVNKEVAQDKEFISKYEFVELSIEVAENHVLQPFYFDEYYDQIRGALEPIITEVIIGDKDIETALTEMEQKVVEIRSE